MSIHTPHPPDAGLPDTGDRADTMPLGRAHYDTASPTGYRTHEIIGVIGLILTLFGIVGHAYVLDDHVKQLDAARATESVQHEGYETRFRTIEATAISDRAAADKREALIEQNLSDITTRLDAIQRGVDSLQAHHR